MGMVHRGLARAAEGQHGISIDVARNLAGLYPKSVRFAHEAALACYARGERAEALVHARRGAGLAIEEMDRVLDEDSSTSTLEDLRDACRRLVRGMER